MGCIYLRKNKVNGKCYVGQAKDVEKRNKDWNKLNTRYGGYVINNARKKYGVDGFSFEILRECPNEEMNYWEMYYIKEYNSKKPYGYNSTDGGDSTYERTEETKAKMSAAMRGRKLPAEVVEKISDALRGRKRPDISDALRGRKHSEEAKEKISDAMRGRKQSPEHIAKRANAHRGKYNTKKSKAVQALNPETLEVVMEFPSIMEAERHGFSHGNISECCLGKRKTAYGYVWRYAEK